LTVLVLTVRVLTVQVLAVLVLAVLVLVVPVLTVPVLAGRGPAIGAWAGALAADDGTTTTTPSTVESTSTTAAPAPTTAPPATSQLPPAEPPVSPSRPGRTSSAPTTTTTTIPPGDLDGPEPPGPHVVPPGAQAVIDAVRRSAPNSTEALMAALHPLVDLGMTEQQAAIAGMGRFPVAGVAHFRDDWLEARFDGGFHFHHGCDVFAAGGTPVRSPTDGVLRQSSDTLGGIVDYVTQADGTYFYMAHLSAYTPGQVSGQAVKTGDVIGFVGNSGDAAGGPTHVHFEYHPGGGGPVDPKAELDRWVADALAAAPSLVAARQGLMSTPDGAAVDSPQAAGPEQGPLAQGFVAGPSPDTQLSVVKSRRASTGRSVMAVVSFLVLSLLMANLLDRRRPLD
jgi:murein DD-endopeptidase MepM/ murein hydrolase activator NlpD